MPFYWYCGMKFFNSITQRTMKRSVRLLNKLSFMRPKRRDVFWRMDRNAFSRFLNYLTCYTESKELSDIEWQTIMHVEIYCSDMISLTGSFGAFDTEGETRFLNEIDRVPYDMFCDNPFYLYVIYTESGGKQKVKRLYVN